MDCFFYGEKAVNLVDFSEFLKIFLQIAQVVTILFAVYKFTRKPHDTLESKHDELKKRVDAHDVEIKEVKDSLHLGNDKFREQEDTNEVMIRSIFALIEFEVHYCETEQKPISKNLERAKDDLHDYLAKR